MNKELENPKNIDLLNQLTHPDLAVTDINSILCRLCANPNTRTIGIYSEEGLSNELSNKMNLYLPIKVSQDDILPLHCCWSCASTVLAWHELVVVSVESDRRLRSVLQENNENKSDNIDINFESLEEATSPLVQDDRVELRSPATGLNVFCQGSSLLQTKTLPLKQKPHTNSNKKQYLVHCNVIADETLFKYLENIQNPSLETNIDTDGLAEFKAEETFESLQNSDCRELISEFSSKVGEAETNMGISNSNIDLLPDFPTPEKTIGDSLNIPLDNISTTSKELYSFSCQYCSLMFVKEDEILEHVKTVHSNKHLEKSNNTTSKTNTKKLRCKKLDQELINSAKVAIEGRVYYSCKICEKILHSPYTYIWHIRIHTGERPYICDLCGKQFRISQGLVRHVKETHEGVKNFGCDICGRMFATRRNVQEHRRIHTNERPYICDLCGKRFKQKASLFVHNRSHSDLYPFKCTYCNQGFRTRPPLLIHITRHTGEKPYPCDVCGRLFRIKYELKRHKLIHSEEKPFSCAVCGLRFRQKRYLINHSKTNHKETVKVESL